MAVPQKEEVGQDGEMKGEEKKAEPEEKETKTAVSSSESTRRPSFADTLDVQSLVDELMEHKWHYFSGMPDRVTYFADLFGVNQADMQETFAKCPAPARGSKPPPRRWAAKLQGEGEEQLDVVQTNSGLFEMLGNLDLAHVVFEERLDDARSVADILPILIDMIAMRNGTMGGNKRSSNLDSRGYSTTEDLRRLQEAVDGSPLSINPSQYEAITEFVTDLMKNTDVPKEIELIAVGPLSIEVEDREESKKRRAEQSRAEQ